MNRESRETPIVVEEVIVCKTCANEFVGKYCNRCGEKVVSPHDKSIMHFLEGVFHMITRREHVDRHLVAKVVGRELD